MKKGALFFLIGIFSLSFLASFWPAPEPQLDRVMQDPQWSHWFGTDSLGRDLLFRVLRGTSFSLIVGLISFAISLSIGSVLGFLAGWKKGVFDFVLMRAVEILSSIPQMVLVTLFVLMLRPWVEQHSGLRVLTLALGIGLTHWPFFFRFVRALVLQESEASYIESAQVMGANLPRIFWRHLLPNLGPALRSSFWSQLPSFLLFESLLSFLGFGLQPPETSLGTLLLEGWKTFSTAPHLLLSPGLALFLILLSFQLVGNEQEIASGELI